MKAFISSNLIIVLLFVLTGCQSTAKGPIFSWFEPTNEKNAVIYVYSDYGYTGISKPKIKLNNQKIGYLSGGGYLVAEVAPSAVSVSVPKSITWDIKTPAIEFDAKEGEEYFVKYTVYPTGSEVYPTGIIDVNFYSELKIIDRNESINELKIRKLSD